VSVMGMSQQLPGELTRLPTFDMPKPRQSVPIVRQPSVVRNSTPVTNMSFRTLDLAKQVQ
jgi:hypothetical protein